MPPSPTSTPTPPPPSPTPTPLPETCTPTLPPQGRTIYLTFDDGPGWNANQNANTLAILDTLSQKGVKATFFVLGAGVDSFPATLVRMVSEGHTVGSHSYDHPVFTDLEDGEIRDQVRRTEDAIKGALGGSLPPGFRYFRPPYGAHDARTDQILQEMGYEIVMWDIDSLDWQYQQQGRPATELADSVISQIDRSLVQSPNVLLHSIHPVTAEALPIILAMLEEGGYRFAPMP